MSAKLQQQPDENQVLAKAVLNAGKALGLNQQAISEVVGRDRSSFSRGINPGSKTGELALLLIRCYRSLYTLVGGSPGDLQHWMQTFNHHIGGVPAKEITSISGLNRVVEYLDAIRGKV